VEWVSTRVRGPRPLMAGVRLQTKMRTLLIAVLIGFYLACTIKHAPESIDSKKIMVEVHYHQGTMLALKLKIFASNEILYTSAYGKEYRAKLTAKETRDLDELLRSNDFKTDTAWYRDYFKSARGYDVSEASINLADQELRLDYQPWLFNETPPCVISLIHQINGICRKHFYPDVISIPEEMVYQ
jgi:hypothetical protein